MNFKKWKLFREFYKHRLIKVPWRVSRVSKLLYRSTPFYKQDVLNSQCEPFIVGLGFNIHGVSSKFNLASKLDSFEIADAPSTCWKSQISVHLEKFVSLSPVAATPNGYALRASEQSIGKKVVSQEFCKSSPKN